MMNLLAFVTFLSFALTLILAPFFSYLFIVTVFSILRRPRRSGFRAERPSDYRFGFVIPAHNEEAGIRRTVESCKAVHYDPKRYTVFVIADNCSDRTAMIAREAGAVVIERRDPTKTGKGSALDYFFNQALPDEESGHLDAVVVIDADTIVDAELLSAFSTALAEGKQWLQSYNIPSNADASSQTRLMTYAFSLYNGVLLRGQEAIGLSVALRGNGMCFATSALERIPWKASGLAEDLEFSWVLRTAGEQIHFLPEACVRSEMPTRWGPAAASQRLRWEWGRRDLIGMFFGPLLKSTRIDVSQKTFYLIELLFPPMVSLLLMLLVAMSVHIRPLFGESWQETSGWLLLVHGFMVFTLVAYALSPIIAMKLPGRYLLSLFDLPVYIIWKLKLSANRKPAEWVRTSRENRREWIAAQHQPRNRLVDAVRRMARFRPSFNIMTFKIPGIQKRWSNFQGGPKS